MRLSLCLMTLIIVTGFSAFGQNDMPRLRMPDVMGTSSPTKGIVKVVEDDIKDRHGGADTSLHLKMAVPRQGASGKNTVTDKPSVKKLIERMAEKDYDVKYVKFNLAMNNASVYLSGDVTTKAKVAGLLLPYYVFELDDSLVIDKVLINGKLCTVKSSGDLRVVAMPARLRHGSIFTAQVFYHGMPAVTSGSFAGIGGINNVVSGMWGTRVTFTESESYHAKEWWPCKQMPEDKIDSVDMWLTIPDTLKAGSNGMLKRVSKIDATHTRYEWSERIPISYYSISVAIAPYIDYSYYMHFSDSHDSMLVQNYIYNNPATLPAFKSVIDSVGMMVDYLSGLYSRYPFWKEKYGHCMVPLSGGMENQTMTSIGNLGTGNVTVVAQELGHQWFGDNVTCGSWRDIFNNEWFACYTEDLFLDHFHNHAEMISDIVAKQDDVKATDTGRIYVDDDSSENRIFDYRLSYEKGSCVLHMLRSIVNNDGIFFSVYKAYQAQFTSSNGTIGDFMEATRTTVGKRCNGISIDSFFNQWAFGHGYPIYTVSWWQNGSDVNVQLNQSPAAPGFVRCFTLPIEIRLNSGTGDTVVRVVNDHASQSYHFTWSRVMDSLTLDPNNWLIIGVDSIFHRNTTEVQRVVDRVTRVYPNPSSTGWHVESLSANCALTLTSITGKIAWQGNAHGTSANVPGDGLKPGVYILKMNDAGDKKSYKLIKK